MLGTGLDYSHYIDRLNKELLRVDAAGVQAMSDAIFHQYKTGGQVFVIGNGGSGTTASHFAEDLGKGLLNDDELLGDSARRLRVMSLTDNIGWLLAVGNDLGYDEVFVQQLKNYAEKDDLLIAISGSGNSSNIIKAVDWGNSHGVKTFGLSGFDGGKLKQIQETGTHVELDDMGMVESIHLCIFHWVLNDVYARIHQCDRHAV